MENIKNLTEATMQQEEDVRIPDKADYMEKINALSPEDKAFMDGYLFAKVTSAAKKGA